jgi:hypothetical protein
MDSAPTHCLSIVMVNVNSLRTRLQEINNFIYSHFNDSKPLLILNDTRLHASVEDPCPNGYTMVREDHISNSSKPGGIAIAVPLGWKSLQINHFDHFKSHSLDIMGIIAFPPVGDPIKLVNVYNHPGNKVSPEVFTKLKNVIYNGKPVQGFLLGDLNSPNVCYGSRTSTPPGLHLQQVLDDQGLLVLNDPTQPTFISASTGLSNLLDMIICEPASMELVYSCQVAGDIGSDHLPVHLQLSLRCKSQVRATRQITDWALFKESLQESLLDQAHLDLSPENIDAQISELALLIRNTHASATTIKHLRTRNGAVLSDETTEWIAIRRKLLKIKLKPYMDAHSRSVAVNLYNRVNRKVRKLLKDEDFKHWQSFAEKAANAPDAASRWKAIKRVIGNNQVKESPLVDETGTLKVDNYSMANIHARRLAQTHTPAVNDQFDNTFKLETENWVSQNEDMYYHLPTPRFVSEEGDEEFSLTDVNEVAEYIASAKTKSAPGIDGVTYEMLKRSPINILVHLVWIFNACITLGYYPEIWKKVMICMIPKPNKDPTLSGSYRPISLLSCISKILECVIRKRFIICLQKRNLINPYQAGYKSGRCTQEHLFRLTEDTYSAFKSRHCNLGVFLDVAGAFDKVWHDGLRRRMALDHLPIKLTRILSSYIDKRKLIVRVGSCKSEEVDMKAGTPQGSCISPEIYNYSTNDTPSTPEPTTPSYYADDSGAWASARLTMDACSKLQSFLNIMEAWCCKWRVALAPEKTQVILFSRCPLTHKQEDVNLVLFGVRLQVSDTAKFLGLIFDRGLRWKVNILEVCTRAQQRLQILKRLAVLQEGRYPSCILKLFDSIITSLFEYGAICYPSMAADHWQRLERIQSDGIRIALRLPRYVPLEIIRRAAGRRPLSQHLQEFALRRFLSIQKTSPIVHETVERHNSVSHCPHHQSALDTYEMMLAGDPLD